MKKIIVALDGFGLYQSSAVAAVITFITSISVGFSYRYFVEGINIFSHSYSFSMPDHPVKEFYLAVIIHPFFETTIDQWLLMLIFLKLKIPQKWIILINTILFSLGHLSNSTLSAINTVFTGFVINYGYFYWLQRSNLKRVAFESALSIHTFHNSLHYLLMFLR